MLEIIALSLIFFSVVIGVLTYLGAHKTFLPLPNMGGVGWVTAIVLAFLAFGFGVTPALMDYRDCHTSCLAFANSPDTHVEGPRCVQAAYKSYDGCVTYTKQEELKKEGETTAGVDLSKVPITEEQTGWCYDIAWKACMAQCTDPEPPAIIGPRVKKKKKKEEEEKAEADKGEDKK